MDLTAVSENLRKRGFRVSVFERGEEAADYVAAECAGRSVGMGGSVTSQELGLFEKLSAKGCAVFWHWKSENPAEARRLAAGAEVYITSANGVAESGEIVNIDGTGNRIASQFWGHDKVYIIIGANKIAPDFEAAVWRARNIAAPKNAKRLGRNTPCAAAGDRCFDCASEARICSALTVLWTPPGGIRETEVVIVDAPLGY